jgi:hypothetical protein
VPALAVASLVLLRPAHRVRLTPGRRLPGLSSPDPGFTVLRSCECWRCLLDRLSDSGDALSPAKSGDQAGLRWGGTPGLILARDAEHGNEFAQEVKGADQQCDPG